MAAIRNEFHVIGVQRDSYMEALDALTGELKKNFEHVGGKVVISQFAHTVCEGEGKHCLTAICVHSVATP